MRISIEQLRTEAQATGFRQDSLEKAAQLLSLLNGLVSHPYLKNRIVLKGGTALNLFHFEVPRLSVDIDLNYIGAIDRETMLNERPELERAFEAVFAREGFAVRRAPNSHAGGKWQLRYESAIGQGANLEVDVNFMYRSPLWPVEVIDSNSLGKWKAERVPVLDIHEIAAGKLAALLSRHQARDLFDAHKILTTQTLDSDKLRLGFVLYGAMNEVDWRTVTSEQAGFEADELSRQLVPMLRNSFSMNPPEWRKYGSDLVAECKEALNVVLPLRENEMEFLSHLLEQGRIEATLLTKNPEMINKIKSLPGLHWTAKKASIKKDN